MNNPYLPTVSLEQILAYQPELPQTKTESRLVNAVLDAINELNAIGCREIAEYMKLDERKLSAAIEIETGKKMQEIVHQYKLNKIRLYVAAHPDESMDEVAKANGYSSDGTLWRFFQRKAGTTALGKVSRAKEESWNRMKREIQERLDRE